MILKTAEAVKKRDGTYRVKYGKRILYVEDGGGAVSYFLEERGNIKALDDANVRAGLDQVGIKNAFDIAIKWVKKI